jgi:predicted nucleic acid-binding protein
MEEGAQAAASTLAALPLCADPDDQKFLELAARCGADCLVTGDRELLKLARRVPFAILTADALEKNLAG